MKAFEDHNVLVVGDPTNQKWKFSYTYFWLKFLTLCQSELKPGEFELYFEQAKNLAHKQDQSDRLDAMIDELTP